MERVVDQVREDAFHLCRVDFDRRRLGPDLETHASRVLAQPREGLADELVHGPELAVRLDDACLEPREVEQLANDAVEACGLLADRHGQPQPVIGRQLEPGARERVGRGEDRGQRRPEVVRYRAQERRLERVAPSQGLGLERLRLEPAALGDDGEQRRERRQEALPYGFVDRRLCVEEEGRHAPQPGLDRQSPLAFARWPFAELEPRALHAEHAGGQSREPSELLVESPATQQVERRLGERVSLGTPLLGVVPPRACPSGERADRDREHEIDGEREPVLALLQVKRMVRRQEEPVEDEHARDRDEHCKGRPPEDRDREHGEHVERAEAEHRHVRLQQRDDRAHEHDDAGARQHSHQKLGPRSHAGNGTQNLQRFSGSLRRAVRVAVRARLEHERLTRGVREDPGQILEREAATVPARRRSENPIEALDRPQPP